MCHNLLPDHPGSLVGRERDVQAILDLLGQQRLITLTGPGGVGKSRLALQVAWDALPAHRDGVFFVSLVEISDPGQVVSTLLQTLGLSLCVESNPQEQLLDYLQGRQMLLVLDNFEQLLPAVPLIAEILQFTEQVNLLVTSRARINLYNEWVYELESLSFPEVGAEQDIENYSSVQLFLQRAHQAGGGGIVTVATARPLARICRLVGGLPLALELAAAWSRALPFQAIADEIENNIDFLTVAWLDLPARQRGLRAVFDHSWKLLDAQAREACRRLSVFHGSIRLDAARRVTAVPPGVLCALVDSSWLHWDAECECYSMPALLRRYAAEKLAADPDQFRELAERYCRYFLEILKAREAALRGNGQKQALDALRADIDNLRQAWDWAVKLKSEKLLAGSLESMFRFYLICGNFGQGLAVFTQAIECWRCSEAGAQGLLPTLWQMQIRQAVFSYLCGETQAAEDLPSLGQDFLRLLENAHERILCLHYLGRVALRGGDYPTALSHFESALSHSRTARLLLLEADSLYLLGRLQHAWGQGTGEYAGLTWKYSEQALTFYRQAGDLQSEGMLLEFQAAILIENWADPARAELYCTQALQIALQVGDRSGECASLRDLGCLSLENGFDQPAREHLLAALAISQEIGSQELKAELLAYLGSACAVAGDYAESHRYLDESLQLSRAIDSHALEGLVLSQLSKLACLLHDGSQAVLYAQQYKELMGMDELRHACALNILGRALMEADRLLEAQQILQQASQLQREKRQQNKEIETLTFLAQVALKLNDPPQALAYANEVLCFLETPAITKNQFLFSSLVCYRVLSANQDLRAGQILDRARRALDERVCRIQDEGLRLSFLGTETNQQILQEFKQSDLPAVDQSCIPSYMVDPLTPREMEVLRLIAEGLADRQIAERLVLSLRTVKVHAHHIYAKLDVNGRRQVYGHAHKLGLL